MASNSDHFERGGEKEILEVLIPVQGQRQLPYRGHCQFEVMKGAVDQQP